MTTWTPDPTFYPSPRMAMKAAPEMLAYVAAFDPDRKTPDAIALARHVGGLFQGMRNEVRHVDRAETIYLQPAPNRARREHWPHSPVRLPTKKGVGQSRRPFS